MHRFTNRWMRDASAQPQGGVNIALRPPRMLADALHVRLRTLTELHHLVHKATVQGQQEVRVASSVVDHDPATGTAATTYNRRLLSDLRGLPRDHHPTRLAGGGGLVATAAGGYVGIGWGGGVLW